jgi:hypothetical protein
MDHNESVRQFEHLMVQRGRAHAPHDTLQSDFRGGVSVVTVPPEASVEVSSTGKPSCKVAASVSANEASMVLNPTSLRPVGAFMPDRIPEPPRFTARDRHKRSLTLFDATDSCSVSNRPKAAY